MTKTLTEQWREGTLPQGNYYIVIRGIEKKQTMIDYYIPELHHFEIKPSECILEVLAPVPSYDEHKELVQKMHILEKKLAIATKALKEYADSSNWYETDDFGISAVDQFACDDYGYNIAKEALKEMEGVK